MAEIGPKESYPTMRPHYRTTLLLALMLMLAAALGPEAAAQRGERCFAETNQCIAGRIREFWEQNGGLAVFGLPLGPQPPGTDVATQRSDRSSLLWLYKDLLALQELAASTKSTACACTSSKVGPEPCDGSPT